MIWSLLLLVPAIFASPKWSLNDARELEREIQDRLDGIKKTLSELDAPMKSNSADMTASKNPLQEPYSQTPVPESTNGESKHYEMEQNQKGNVQPEDPKESGQGQPNPMAQTDDHTPQGDTTKNGP